MIKKSLFETHHGVNVYAYTLSDEISVTLLPVGARIMNICVPDKNGNMTDVALNMTNVNDVLYKSGYMGATIGRCGNRIGGGKYELNGKTYFAYHSEDTSHVHHGGKAGFDKKFFAVTVNDRENSVTMSTFSPDGEEGYPGDLTLMVKFTVRGSSLSIEYFARSGKTTLFNPTNHVYFNLNGQGDPTILDNVAQINASAYLPTDEMFVPTGEIKPVKGTPFDFTAPKPIGRDIGANDKDLISAGGYDHNFCLDSTHAATVRSPKTGIRLDCYTDLPGMQFYVGNFLCGEVGKAAYPYRSGFCLETQFYPDAVHHEDWRSPVLFAGNDFYSKTTYAFSVEK